MHATDAHGNYVSLTYFGGVVGLCEEAAAARRAAAGVGRLDQYGQELQIVHPELGEADEALREREAIYPLSEGLTSRRLAALAEQAVARAPVLPEWIEPG